MLTIYIMGKCKNMEIKSLAGYYVNLIKKYYPVAINEITESHVLKRCSISSDEEKRIIKRMDSEALNIILDHNGETFSSEDFSKFIGQNISCFRNINFFIGGAFGFSDRVKSKASRLLSLSRLTTSHELTLVILLEQIFRAFTILRNEKYHK